MLRRARCCRAALLSGVVAILVTGLGPVGGAHAGPVLSGADASTLPREPQIRPESLGSDPIDGLIHADPTEQIDLIDPPTANNLGGAELALELGIPRGRGGVQPDLALAYDSGGGNGWLGTGWDLSVGEIAVDTRWGVPRYMSDKESETYTLDGAVLSPTAVRSTLQDRVAERADFTRRIETEYELIIRHGNSPKNYWWEVRDKLGGIRWYGGKPDLGGPNGDRSEDEFDDQGEWDETAGLDPDAVLRDDDGNIYRWALSAERDVGVNMIRYFYETVDGKRVGAERETMGRQLYLKRILYTAASFVSEQPEDPAYEVRLLRDGDLDPAPAPRKDVVVDARGGFLQVTSDLLRRVEVWHGEPNADGSPRTYDELSKRHDLHYREGAFGKTLLASVDQVGSDGSVYASNAFDYYDEVRNPDGSYDGFASNDDWDSVDDNLQQSLVVTQAEISALGGSETNAGDVHAYLGFNPGAPSKQGSFGGALTVKGGATEGLSEMIDINGDLLPDKVYREGRGTIRFRLNTSGPDGGTTFGDGHTVANLDKLSTDFDVGVGGGAEAYFGLAVQFNVSADVTVGEDYFTDANGDGLPDFVSAGTVRFNHLENGIPTFTSDSSRTPVPVESGDLDLPQIDELEELEQRQREQSPLQDTVRRWVAPFAGTISIDAPVKLDPPPSTDAYDDDGVRVAIQRGGDELWSATLDEPDETATPSGVGSVSVSRGQAVYFRVGSIDNGSRDQVRWDPRITYTSYAGTTDTPAPDVNDLSQQTFDASDDFTLAGRPDTRILMPFTGRVRFSAVLNKTKVTSDDVRVLVRKKNEDGVVTVIDRPIGATTVGAIDIEGDFDVAGPRSTGADELVVQIAVDSPIDVTALSWAPRLFYLSATTSEGEPVTVTDPMGHHTVELEVPNDIDIYPRNTLAAPRTPWQSDLDRTVTVRGAVSTLGDTPAGDVVLTIKQRGRLVGKRRFTVPAGSLGSSGAGTVDVTLANGEDYWFDLSIRSAGLSDRVVSSSVELGWEDAGGPQTRTVPHVRNWAGSQGIFPISYRGWGFAGYNGDGDRATDPIQEDAFVFREADFPQRKPTGFDDTGYQDPMADADAYPFTPYQLDLRDADGNVTGTIPVWRGVKDNLVGAAGIVRSSRRGVDNPSIDQPSGSAGGGSGVQAVRRVGVEAPFFALTGSAGPFGVSFGAGPSFGLLDYMDLNGDGFPDVVAPGYVQYTGARGGYFDSGSGVTVVSQDFTFAAGGGFSGSAVDVKANSQGDANTAQNTSAASGTNQRPAAGSAAQGSTASLDQYGASIGGSFGVQANFTNPIVTDPEWDEGLDEMPSGPGALEEELADVNGDGLPDKVAVDANGVRVRFNLGYGFDSNVVRWSGGGFEAGEAFAGSVGAALGFQINNKEFSGGLGYSEGVDYPRYSWADVDGDGVLDRLRKDGSEIKVAFGTGAGVMDEVHYGDMAEGEVELALPTDRGIPTGQQVAHGLSKGLGAGVDFTIGIGPLCLAGCYIIVNPGVHFDHSISSNQVQLADVNGDGYPDSLRSDADDTIGVRLNNRGRTNLLKSVTNSLGGEVRLRYRRAGNSQQQPYSQWELASVEADDNRAGDGPDTLLTTYEYSGNEFDKLEREFLGHSKVVERQRAYADDGDVFDDPVIRSTEREYRNDTVFDSGLVTSEKLVDPDGKPLRETRTRWELIDVETGDEADLAPPADGSANVRLLGLSVSPHRARVEQRWYDVDGSVGEETWNTFEYDDLGNVVRQVDVGEPELAGDDTVALTTYTNCDISSSDDLKDAFGCPADRPVGRISPLWDPHRCPTWTSLPAVFEIRDGDGNVLRQRDGRPALCDNSSVTRLEERLGGGDVAVTELSYDSWGSYNRITYPENADGERMRVDYVYDDDSHANVALTHDSHGKVTEFDCPDPANPCDDDDFGSVIVQPGITATATFDGRTGRIASRTDANGHTTSYAYDAAGRLAAIVGPYEQGAGDKTVTLEYFPNAPGYAYAVAHHFDAFHAGDTIDTATFVDGIGRRTQTKQDATLFRGAGLPARNGMVVSGAVEFDALGRPVKEWYPTEEALGTIGAYNTGTAATDPTETAWTLTDLEKQVVTPDGSTITTDYGFGTEFGAKLFTTRVTDAEGKPQRSFSDVHDNVLAVDDMPAGAPVQRTRYDYDPLGQLVQVVDNAGNVTTHAYDLYGRRTATRTPDGGLVESRFDAASNLTARITPKLRAAGQEVAYDYDIERLVGVDHPGDTPDVSYEYGDAGAAGNGAARVVGVTDGAREQRLAYDPLGALARETSTMQVHNLNDETAQRLTFTTELTYDGFGRTRTLTYPDGEVLSHDYDSGGLLASVAGEKGFFQYPYLDRLEYDEFLDRRFQQTGNGVQTEYAYNADTRRLARQKTDTPVREIQDLNYSYDRVGNVLRMANELPAPVPELKGGPSVQNYRYDPYYRLRSADGEYLFAPRKRRNYTFSNTYDVHGNVATKSQTDVINGKLVQKPTTYDLAIAYGGGGPHQVNRIGSRPYTYDVNGNFTGWTDDRTGQNRSATWDATDRMRTVADQGSTTRFTYDEAGRRAIERGPQGETAFVNQWYTVRNGTVSWKHIWAGDDRLATQRSFDDGAYEHMRYFLHKDLQGSSNVITDDQALVFEHMEYFPSGETWVLEHSDIHRTPYLYGGGYVDEVRNLIDLGARWYEPREQFLYGPDPVLQDDPAQVVDDPALLPAYSYAESNPLRLVDVSGRAPSSVKTAFTNAFARLRGRNQPAAAVAQAAAAQNTPPAAANQPAGPGAPQQPAAQAAAAQQQAAGQAAPAAAAAQGAAAPAVRQGPAPRGFRSSRLWQKLERLADREERSKKLAGFTERFEAKPLVAINLGKTASGWRVQEVKVSPTFFLKQFTVFAHGRGAAGGPNALAAQPQAGQAAAAAPSSAAP